MAKKTVATLQEGKTDGRSYTKVIKMVKSPKTGAYIVHHHHTKKHYDSNTNRIPCDIKRHYAILA